MSRLAADTSATGRPTSVAQVAAVCTQDDGGGSGVGGGKEFVGEEEQGKDAGGAGAGGVGVGAGGGGAGGCAWGKGDNSYACWMKHGPYSTKDGCVCVCVRARERVSACV